MEGWIKLHRKLLDNPVANKDPDHLAVWAYILLNATHTERPVMFGGKKIMLQPGQLITGRKVISEKMTVSESKVERVLKTFEIEQQIEQQTSTKNRVISILSWDKYQISDNKVNNDRTTTEQRLDTNKNVRREEGKEPSKKSGRFTPPTLSEIQSYIHDKGMSVDAKKFFEYFTEGNWIDSKGNKVKSWKQKLITWNNQAEKQTGQATQQQVTKIEDRVRQKYERPKFDDMQFEGRTGDA